MDSTGFLGWMDGYESAWRSPGTDRLRRLFSSDAVYLTSPYAEPVVGLDDIAVMWEEERGGPGEAFTMSREAVAVSGDVGVGRVEVAYGEPVRQHYRDLWIVRFDDAGLAVHFEEWPFWPDHGTTLRTRDPVVLDAAVVDAAPWREVLRSGSLSAGVYALGVGAVDGQQPHAQDEVYVVVDGVAELEIEGRRHPVRAGSIAYVPARAEHRFVDVTADLRTAVVFAPPEEPRG